jgi:ATP-dependent RNA helicase RhlE
VSHVVNYDVPQHPEDYVHRIGRTGRMEATGDAFTLMVAEDIRHVNAIEHFISMKIPRVKLENFDYKYTTLFEEGKRGQPLSTGRVRGARVRGGYFFGPARRRR